MKNMLRKTLTLACLTAALTSATALAAEPTTNMTTNNASMQQEASTVQSDRGVVHPQQKDMKENQANIRLISSCSVIMLFLFLNIYFKTMEYDEFLLCYIVLVLGRFIFFDSTINEFKKSLGDLKEYVIPLIIAFILTGIKIT